MDYFLANHLVLSATQVLTQIPSSPGASPVHWTTRTLIIGLCVGVLIAIVSGYYRNRLLDKLRNNLTVRILVYFSEAAAAVLLSVVASYFDVFKHSTYVPTATYEPDWHVIFWGAAWFSVAAYYCVVKYLAIATKEGEESQSKRLSQELGREKTAVMSLTGQRDLFVKITSFARNMVVKKIDRLAAMLPAKPVSVERFFSELNPKLQVQTNVKMIHEFFRSDDAMSAKLRLALWTKETSSGRGPERLSIAYSWDGESDACFSNQSAARMILTSPAGCTSEVVKCYHATPQTIKIIPSCVRAQRDRQFDFFYPEQRNKVGSLIVYKHMFRQQKEPLAVVLLLVSSQEDHFKAADEDQIKQFLDEMLTRIEMEWILVELIRDLGLIREAA